MALLRSIKIGSLDISGNFFLAPMAGFTDRPFRSLCKELGVPLTYSEMISCEGIIRNNPKTTDLVEGAENEFPYAIQIFTDNHKTAVQSLKVLNDYRFELIDLNCGCPVPKVVKTGAGSALMKTPKKIHDIVKALKDHTNFAVTIKIRTGWDHNSLNFLEVSNIAEKAGVDAICLHGRTRSQGYSGQSDIDAVKKLKENSSVPIIASGDMFTTDDVMNVLSYTLCDAVMIARGAVGNPFVFQQLQSILNEVSVPCPSTHQKIAVALKHLRMCIIDKGENLGVKEMRKHLSAYTKGIPGGSAARSKLVKATSENEVLKIFNEFL